MKARKPTSGRRGRAIRSAKTANRARHPATAAKAYDTKRDRHPAFGALKGMVHIPPGVDLTKPALPDWEKIWLEANAWWLDDPKLNPIS